MMRKIGKAQKIGITFAVVCCVLLAMVFSTDLKNLFVFTTNVPDSMVGTEAEIVNTMIVMETDDAVQKDDYIAFGVYAPSTATYTIGVTAEDGKVRVNTGEATAVNGTELSVSLTEGTNVLYFVDCLNPSIQWDSEICDLEPVNKVCMPLSGDVNQSGDRTVEDLVLIKKEAAATGSSNIERTEIADIDRDDSVTNEDASQLRTLLVGNPEYKVAERSALIVDAYIEETGTLYDTLAEAVAEASTISTTNSKSVTVTVLNPTDVKMVKKEGSNISIPVTDEAQIELKDDGWRRTITRTTGNFKMFGIGQNASLTLTGSSGSDVNSSLILDGGAKASGGNHIVDVGNALQAASAELIMNAGVKITNNENNGATSSGGALAVKGTFNMNGGVISGNIAKGTGGAINLLNGSKMNMAGGTITENETQAETFSGGGINISGGATLIMNGGTIYGNISPVSVDNNSVRVSGETSVLEMGGSAYIDRVCIDTASSVTPSIKLNSALATTEKITLFFPQPLNKTDVVVRNSSYAQETTFDLSDRMLPCKLVWDDVDNTLCLESDITEMDSIKATLEYSNYAAFNGIDDTWAVQGVCTDGTYLYAAIEQEPTVGVTYNGCKILKVNLATWEQEAVSDVLATDHSNEMTYNSKTGKIYITHCMSSGAFTETTGITSETGPYAISVVNPESLTVEEVITLPDTTAYTGTTGIYALAYSSTHDYYVAGCTGFRFGFLKDDNGTITECAMPSTGMEGFTGYTAYVKQGVYANDTTIYANTWNDKEINKGNFITMYDWSGNYNGTKYVVDKDGNAFMQESESMFEYNGVMYIACIPTGHIGVDIYKLEDVGEATSTIDVKDADGTIVDGVYTNLADAIAKANELGTATIVLKEDVTIGATQTITGNVTITDDGTKRTLQRSTGCTNEMFNVAGGAELTFTSSSMDDNNPMLVIDGNKANVTTTNYAPVVHMNQTNGILNITPGVIVQNNKSHNAGGVIIAGANKNNSDGGGQAIINITGGLFTGNEVDGTSQHLFGGCIYIEAGCTLNISNATFEQTMMQTTHASGVAYGGVIAVRTNINQTYSSIGANVTLNNCTFNNTKVTQNVTTSGGGVLYIGAGNKGNVQITDCEFTSNSTVGLGGAIDMRNKNTELVLSGCTFSGNTDKTGTNDIYMVASTNVNVSGNTQANINCAGTEQIHIAESLGADSVIQVNVSDAAAGATVATFENADVMADCKAKGNLILLNESYALNYETTSDSKYVAKLANAVATIGEQRYASLAEAIEAANALDSATIVLKADVTVEATQAITGNVTITDDGATRKITREGFTDRMFEVAAGANLTFIATSTDNTNPTLTIDGNGEVAGASGAMVSLGTGSGTLAVNNAVQFTNANINEDGGIIRTEAGSTAKVTINGGVFDNNTAEVTGALNGGLIKVVGEAEATISNALFENNEISSTGDALKGGIVYISGGTVNVVGSTFTSNTAYTYSTGSGGVIGVYDNGTLNVGQYDNTDNETITGTCLFTDNEFTGKSYGGAISINTASANVYNTTIQRNTAYNGGAIHVPTNAELFVGDSTITDNTTTEGSARTNINVTYGTVKLEGTVKASIFCSTEERLHVKSKLTEDSEVKVTWLNSSSGITEGETVVTFKDADVMADCQKNGYLVLVDNKYVLSQDYTLVYDTTDNTAKLASVVATIGEQRYASLADAIEAANELDSAIIVLEADVTVGATQTIEGNVTITDDGNAWTITREEGFTDRMFEVASDAGLTFTATGTNNESPTLTIDGNNVGPSGAMVSLGTGSGTFAVNNAVQFTNANINEDGGIIRTEAGSTARVTIDGGVFAYNTVAATDNAYGLVDGDTPGDVYGGLINVAGSAEVTISNALFRYNEISAEAGLVKGGILYVEGGTVNIVGSTFASNTSTTTNAGGGLLRIDSGTLNIGKYTDEDGTTTVEDACTFTDNSFTASKTSRVYGGVISLGDNASAQVYNSTFTSNTAELGNISLNNGATLTIGDSELANNITTSTTVPDVKDIRATGTSGKVIVEGKVKTTVYCNNSNKLQIGSLLEADSEITLTGSTTVITEGKTLVSFTGDNAADVMADCKANGYLKVTSEDYTLVYDTTDNTAKLTSVVATIGEQKYASLEDAIEAANELDSATIVLKADVTVDETQEIKGSVTITDDGTAKTITRGAECTAQMFDVQESASLTLAGTGTLAEDSSTVQGTITVDGNNVTATASMIVNAGTFSLGTNASLTNATYPGSSSNVTYGGALYNTGTVALAGTLSGNEAYYGGALYNASGTMTITGGTFESNSAYHGGVVYTAIGTTLDITGGTFGTEGKGNTSEHRAGAVYVEEGTSAEQIASVTISNATFSYNTSTNSIATSSGAIYIGKYADVIINTCGFSNNSAECTTTTTVTYGGAIYMDTASVDIEDSTFSANEAINGGAIYATNVSTELVVKNTAFTDNVVVGTTSTTTGNGHGGAIYVNAATVQITDNSSFNSNSAYRGGAIFVGSGGNLTLQDCQMDNTASQYGPDILTNGGSDKITLLGLIIAEIDKRAQVLDVKGSLTTGSSITIGQISGTATVFVQFDSLEDMNNSKDYIHFDVANNKFPNGTLYFDETTYQAIIQE